VDTKFFPSGWEGDIPQIHLVTGADGGTGCASRSSANAKGGCYKWTFDNKPGGTTLNDSGAVAQGFAAVEYQSLAPSNGYQANWGAAIGNTGMADPGILIPPGATKVSFWAKGAVGREVVSFGVGQITTAICNDAIVVPATSRTLTRTWTQYTIPLPAGASYASGQIIGFNWNLASQTIGDSGSSHAPITFYIDDMEWIQ
jgi:hypothetical protein